MMRTDKKTIGIIGGGQLGQMMAISAQYMGHRVITLDPNSLCSAAKVSDSQIVADYDDVNALEKLAEACDVLTYEFENVSAEALTAVRDKVSIPQGIRLLEITQNRRSEKEFLTSIGMPVAAWKSIRSAEDLPMVIDKKQVLKTVTGGYDGHGQVVLSSEADRTTANQLVAQVECVLEDFVTFDREVSVILSGNGREYVAFPLAENLHRENILHRTIAPARVEKSVAEKARELGLAVAEELKLSGTLCVEIFLTADDTLIVNELAPRPHNSGHYTIEACDFSQFDLHIKGVLGERLPQPRLLKPALMLNVLGQHLEHMPDLIQQHPDWHLHDYGKLEAKHNRKMGHVTILTDDLAQSLSEVEATGIW